MTAPYTLADLKTAYQRKEKLKYLYFWGHTPKHKNEIDKAIFSQWYPAPFEIDGIRYATAEHYMRPLQNSPKSPKFPPRHLGDFP